MRYIPCPLVLFFSSRRRHTRCDWSSDVCSSDLEMVGEGLGQGFLLMPGLGAADVGDDDAAADHPGQAPKAVVHQVPLIDAVAGFFDVHLPFPEKPDTPAAHVVPRL